MREAARLQGLPDWFDFGDQRDAQSFKQLGNGVNIGAAYYVFRQHVLRDASLLGDVHPVVKAVRASAENPDEALAAVHPRVAAAPQRKTARRATAG